MDKRSCTTSLRAFNAAPPFPITVHVQVRYRLPKNLRLLADPRGTTISILVREMLEDEAGQETDRIFSLAQRFDLLLQRRQ